MGVPTTFVWDMPLADIMEWVEQESNQRLLERMEAAAKNG